MAIVAPSLLAADFLHLDREIEMINKSDAAWLHLDIMDGRFVPNISFGLPIIESIRKASPKLFDVHLMIEEPGKYAEDFRNVGADLLTVHYEACPHLHRNIQQIKGLGMKAGVALNPHTPVTVLADIIYDIDLVLIMSVNPGFGGQQFIENTYQKIRQTRALAQNVGATVLIEVDGGVGPANAVDIVAAGADVLVAGNAVFKNANPASIITLLHQL